MTMKCLKTKRCSHFAGHALLAVVLVTVVALAFGGVVMVAWNAVIPDLLHLSLLTYGQSVALLVLARLLTGRFTHGPHGWHRRHGSMARESAALYTAWWDAEGEAAFKEYVARQTGGAGQG